MSNATVRTTLDGDVLIVTIDRASVRNAVDGPTALALAEAFRRFDADAAQSVAVLTGAGGSFCSGADLSTIAPDHDRRLDVNLDGDAPLGVSRMTMQKPVIAAVEGHAVAGGLELALWCDLRVAAEDAVFGVFCRRFGVPLMDGGTIRLPRIVGQSRALDMILTGRPVSAAEALRFGLADRVVPPGGALAAAVELAHEIARHPQTCMRSDRMSLYEQWSLTTAAALRNESERGLAVIASGETLAGAARFRAGEGRHGAFRERDRNPG
jgi:enoyl-CoA hydratase